MYTYKAKVVKVYDGDTITVNIDLGFGIEMQEQKVRLLNINTPEIRGEEREQGLISRDRLKERILDKEVILKTYKDKKGKYGRWLAEVFIEEENLNEWLINEGLAKRVDY
jgi:micrococcal nuclease